VKGIPCIVCLVQLVIFVVFESFINARGNKAPWMWHSRVPGGMMLVLPVIIDAVYNLIDQHEATTGCSSLCTPSDVPTSDSSTRKFQCTAIECPFTFCIRFCVQSDIYELSYNLYFGRLLFLYLNSGSTIVLYIV
jgi:hypothetical protein